jgi:hypothetical protein
MSMKSERMAASLDPTMCVWARGQLPTPDRCSRHTDPTPDALRPCAGRGQTDGQGATNAETVFVQPVNFAKQLNEEERRGIREQSGDEQLAILDILTRPSPPLTKAEREQVKRLARELLDTLKAERLVLPQVAQPAGNPCRCASCNQGCAGQSAREVFH